MQKHLLEHITDEYQRRLSYQLNYTFLNSILARHIEIPFLDIDYNRFHQFLQKKKGVFYLFGIKNEEMLNKLTSKFSKMISNIICLIIIICIFEINKRNLFF